MDCPSSSGGNSGRVPHISLLRCGIPHPDNITPMPPHANPTPNKLYYGDNLADMPAYLAMMER